MCKGKMEWDGRFSCCTVVCDGKWVDGRVPCQYLFLQLISVFEGMSLGSGWLFGWLVGWLVESFQGRLLGTSNRLSGSLLSK